MKEFLKYKSNWQDNYFNITDANYYLESYLIEYIKKLYISFE